MDRPSSRFDPDGVPGGDHDNLYVYDPFWTDAAHRCFLTYLISNGILTEPQSAPTVHTQTESGEALSQRNRHAVFPGHE